MEFNDDPPKEVCDKAPDKDTYEPKLFSTTALSLGKVDLTWDETDPQRLAAMKKAFEMEEGDGENDELLKQFIADSSSDNDEIDPPQDTEHSVAPPNILANSDEGEFSEEDDEKVIAKYRALLQGTSDHNSKDNLADKDSDSSDGMEMVFKEENIKEDEEKSVEKMTPWEKYLHKKKEKRKQKKRPREETIEDNEEDQDDNDDIPSDVDLNDPFFKEELSSLKTAKIDKTGKKKRKTDEKNVKSNDLELLTMGSDDDHKHFDYKEIVDNESKSKKKRMKKKNKKKGENISAEGEDNFKMDLEDQRFSAIFNNPRYNVDPSHPRFKKTKSMASIIEEKQKRIIKSDKEQKNNESESTKPVKKSAKQEKSSGLLSLANSVKSKSDKLKQKRQK